jgi:hypothetical protein
VFAAIRKLSSSRLRAAGLSNRVKVEFTVYDGEGNQIAIVFGNDYDFKPGSIWRFEILGHPTLTLTAHDEEKTCP